MNDVTISSERYMELLLAETSLRNLKTFLADRKGEYVGIKYEEIPLIEILLFGSESEVK